MSATSTSARKEMFQVIRHPDGTETKRSIGFESTAAEREAWRQVHILEWAKGGERDLERKAILRRVAEKLATGAELDDNETNAVADSYQGAWGEMVMRKVEEGAPLHTAERSYVERCLRHCADAGRDPPMHSMAEQVEFILSSAD